MKSIRGTSNALIAPRLPCLRCGKMSVGYFVPIQVGEPTCNEGRCRHCDTVHLLMVDWFGIEMVVAYHRFTGRYPIDSYDNPGEVPVVKLKPLRGSNLPPATDDESCYGPIVIYPRKGRFTKAELKQIWSKTDGKCHLSPCQKNWKLDERGPKGWHVDHKIAHASGGEDTERMVNFFVACATCNLRKGTGVREKAVRHALEENVFREFRRRPRPDSGAA